MKGKIKMRELETIQKRHRLNKVYAADEKGPGGANHIYMIESHTEKPSDNDTDVTLLCFQYGPRNEEGSIAGIIDSDLLEIVRDRLSGFQEGEHRTRENALALMHVESALLWLSKRVEDRNTRGVLGTNVR